MLVPGSRSDSTGGADEHEQVQVQVQEQQAGERTRTRAKKNKQESKCASRLQVPDVMERVRPPSTAASEVDAQASGLGRAARTWSRDPAQR